MKINAFSKVLLISFILSLIVPAFINEVRAEEVAIDLELTFPVGKSPSVFTVGWHFGARAIAKEDGKAEEDISHLVQWSGTAKFTPNQGAKSSPKFNAEGANTIELVVTYKEKTEKKTFTVNAVSPYEGGVHQGTRRYAVVSDIAICPADGHGAPADPLPVRGPITSGSPTVSLDGLPVARLGDKGIHAACSGPNTFVIAGGDRNVLIDGWPAARIGDKTQHCGGVGAIGGSTGIADKELSNDDEHDYYGMKSRLSQFLGKLINLDRMITNIKSEVQKKILIEKSEGDTFLDEIPSMTDRLSKSDSSQDQDTQMSKLIRMHNKISEHVDRITQIKIAMQASSAKVCFVKVLPKDMEDPVEAQALIEQLRVSAGEVAAFDAQAKGHLQAVQELTQEFRTIEAKSSDESSKMNNAFKQTIQDYKNLQGQLQVYAGDARSIKSTIKQLDEYVSTAQASYKNALLVQKEISAINKSQLRDYEKDDLKAVEDIFNNIQKFYPTLEKNISDGNEVKNSRSDIFSEVIALETKMDEAAKAKLTGVETTPSYNEPGLSMVINQKVVEADKIMVDIKYLFETTPGCFEKIKPEGTTDQEEESSTGDEGHDLSAFIAQLDELATQIATLNDKGKNLIGMIKTDIKLLIKDAAEYEKLATSIADKIRKEADSRATSNTQMSPQSIIYQMKPLSEQVSLLKDKIEGYAVTVCERYEQIGNNPKLPEADTTYADAKSQLAEVTATFNKAQKIMEQMNTLKEKSENFNLGTTIDPEVQEVIREGKDVSVQAGVVRKSGENIVAGKLKGLEDLSAQATDILSQAQELMSKIEVKAQAELSKDEKKQIKNTQRTLKSIEKMESKVIKSSSKADDLRVEIGKYLWSIDASQKKVDTVIPYLEVQAGASDNKDINALKEDIRSMYDAGMLFSEPIQIAQTSAQTCMSGVSAIYADIDTPENRVAVMDCSTFPGTTPQWNEAIQKADCFCTDGLIWNQNQNKCLNKKDQAMATANCTAFLNTEAMWNEPKQMPLCECKAGFVWNRDRTACELSREEQVARISCASFGPQGYAAWSEADGGVRCFCQSGYRYNSKRTRCVKAKVWQPSNTPPPSNSGGYKDSGRSDLINVLTGLLDDANGRDENNKGNHSGSNQGGSTYGGNSTSGNDCAYNYTTSHSGGLYGGMTMQCNCSGYIFSGGKCVRGSNGTNNKKPAGFTGGNTGGGNQSTGCVSGGGFCMCDGVPSDSAFCDDSNTGSSTGSGITTNTSRSQGAGDSSGSTNDICPCRDSSGRPYRVSMGLPCDAYNENGKNDALIKKDYNCDNNVGSGFFN